MGSSSKNAIMKHKANTELWVNEVMDSLCGMQRIPADPQLYDHIMSRLSKSNSSDSSISSVFIKRISAAAILLLIINIATVFHLSHKAKFTQQTSIYQEVQEEMNYLSADNY